MPRIPQRRGKVNTDHELDETPEGLEDFEDDIEPNSAPSFLREEQLFKDDYYGYGFLQVPTSLLRVLPPDEALFFIGLLNYRMLLAKGRHRELLLQNEGNFFCPVERLATILHINKKVQWRLLKNLSNRGFVYVWQKHHKNKRGSVRWIRLELNIVMQEIKKASLQEWSSSVEWMEDCLPD